MNRIRQLSLPCCACTVTGLPWFALSQAVPFGIAGGDPVSGPRALRMGFPLASRISIT
jgi:hypothetical protein